MEENYIFLEEENQIEVSINDACGLVPLFWNCYGEETPSIINKRHGKHVWAYIISFSIFKWAKQGQYKRFLIVQGSSIFKIKKKIPHSWLLYIADPYQLLHKNGSLNIVCVLPIVNQSF